MKKYTLLSNIFILIFYSFFLNPFLLFGNNSLAMELKVLGINDARDPEFFEENIIFTYRTDEQIRYVGIRFEHEDFKKMHIYTKNVKGIYFFIYPIPPGYDHLKYRIVVDGLWMSDPFNSRIEKDPFLEVNFSVLKITEKPMEAFNNPSVKEKRHYNFVYLGNPGMDVFIIGGFNDWDPFMNRLVESPDRRGYYFINIEVGPGRHYYNFIINGTRIADPYNSQIVYDEEGNRLSYFDTIERLFE